MSGAPRVGGITERLSRCNLRLVVQLRGRNPPDEQELVQIRDNIGGNIRISSGQSRTTADFEIAIQKRSTIFTDEDLENYLGAIRQVLINTHQVEGWMVEA